MVDAPETTYGVQTLDSPQIAPEVPSVADLPLGWDEPNAAPTNGVDAENILTQKVQTTQHFGATLDARVQNINMQGMDEILAGFRAAQQKTAQERATLVRDSKLEPLDPQTVIVARAAGPQQVSGKQANDIIENLGFSSEQLANGNLDILNADASSISRLRDGLNLVRARLQEAGLLTGAHEMQFAMAEERIKETEKVIEAQKEFLGELGGVALAGIGGGGVNVFNGREPTDDGEQGMGFVRAIATAAIVGTERSQEGEQKISAVYHEGLPAHQFDTGVDVALKAPSVSYHSESAGQDLAANSKPAFQIEDADGIPTSAPSIPGMNFAKVRSVQQSGGRGLA
jgi:hypothetical protein